MTTTSPAYAVKYNDVDGTWDVCDPDPDGDAVFGYDARSEVEGLLCDADLSKLRAILAILKS